MIGGSDVGDGGRRSSATPFAEHDVRIDRSASLKMPRSRTNDIGEMVKSSISISDVGS